MSVGNRIARVDFSRLLPFAAVACAILAYSNSFYAPFILDDHNGIEDNLSLRHFWSSLLGSTRPLVRLTFHLNYLMGSNPADYHAVNLLIHIAAGLLLFGIVKRTLTLPAFADGYGKRASVFAAIVSAIWLVHPLQTESVTYISQRAESLMGFFYLLTLFLFLIGVRSRHSLVWHTATIIACALGMVAKPVMVTAPVMVLIYDRFFFAKSFCEALAMRRRVYIGLALTWAILGGLLSVPHDSSATTGLKAGLLSPLAYLQTQQGVIIHYLKLSFWPARLCLDYAWLQPISRGDIWIPAFGVGFLVLLTWIAVRRRSSFGFCGLWFFMALAPTSSVIPIADCAAEHRMYLPLAGVIVLTVFSIYGLLRNRVRPWIMLATACAVIVVLGMITWQRNQTYQSEEAIWRDVINVRPDNFRAYVPVISALLDDGRAMEAQHFAEVALRRMRDAVASDNVGRLSSRALYWKPAIQNQMGRALLVQGDISGAIACFRATIQADPDKATAWHNLGYALYLGGNKPDAMKSLNRAVELNSSYDNPRLLIARMLVEQGSYREAAGEFQHIRGSDQASLSAKCEFAWLLATCPDAGIRDGNRAIEMAEEVCRATRNLSVRALDVLAAAYAEAGRFDDAVKAASQALILISKGRPKNDSIRLLSGVDGVEFVVPVSEQAVDIQSQIKLYENHQAYRMEPNNNGQQNSRFNVLPH